jgi:D-alanyl-D-alanine carboxypeptidase
MSPVARLRQSATPCQSGVAHASAWRTAGSCEIGKKVPEKRKRGTSPKRKTAASHSSPSTLVVTAASAAPNASPHRSAANGASTASGETKAPPIAAIAAKIVTAMITRIPHHVRIPATSSGTRTGVETAAWYVRSHLKPARTGKVVTLAAVCIAVVASSSGATNCT